MKKRHALVFVLCALAGSMVLACSDDNKSGDSELAELTVDPSAIQLKEGESKSFTIHYNPSTDLVVTSGNSECVTLDGESNKVVTTSSDSNVSVNVTAVGQDCTSVITIVDRNDATISKTVEVTVEAKHEEPPTPDKPVLSVDPTSLELIPEGGNLINISYAENADLHITSSDSDCVKVNDEEQVDITTDAEGNAAVKANAVGLECTAIVTIADKDDASINKKVNVKVLGISEEMPLLTVSPDSIELVSGGEDTVVATYIMEESGTALPDETLILESSNPDCATTESSVVTDANGNADIKVTAVSTEACNAMISVTPPKGSAKNIAVTVSEAGPVVTGGSLTFAPASVNIAYNVDKTGTISLLYKDANGDGVANANVKFDYDETCVVSDKQKKAKTDDNGEIAIVLAAQKDNCTTQLVAHAGDLDASAEITVVSKTEFSIMLETAIDAAKYDKIGSLLVGTSGQTCADLAGTNLQASAESIVDEMVELNGTSPILGTYPMTGIPIAQKSVLAIGKSSEHSKVSNAYGCKDISVDDDGKTVHLDLIPVPTEIKGTYDVVTNFDFTNAIQPSGEVIVEKMTGGDWLKFLLDFFEKPADALITLFLNNYIEALKKVGDDSILQAVELIETFNIESVYSNIMESLLKEETINLNDGTTKSYNDIIIEDIAPIITDALNNMQLMGTMDITDAMVDGAINKGNEKFTEIQYIWPFDFNKACVIDAYAKSDVKCRNRMLLDNKKSKIVESTDWTGMVTDEKMDITPHSVDFKWASVLASVAVIEVMPTVFDYKSSVNYKNGKYFSVLLEKFGFDLIIRAYNKKHEEDPTSYPELNTSSTSSSCVQAFRALLYMNSNNSPTASLAMVLPSFGNLFCASLENLDDYAWPALAKIESSTDNMMTLEAKGCALSEASLAEEGKENPFDGMYTRMGMPDDPVVTANEVFGDDKKATVRCTWDLKNGAIDQTVNGLFHSTRLK